MTIKSRERITVSITNEAGVYEDWGVFDTWAGGEATGDVTKHRAGGGAKGKAIGGTMSIGDVTISRLYELERDHGRVKPLKNRCNRARIIAVRQKLDIDFNAFGDPDTYTGVVSEVTDPESDSEDDDTAMLELKFVADDTVT